MSLLNYLPEKSEYSIKVAEFLKPYENKMYAIGSNARKTLYGLKTGVNDYNFLYSCSCSTVAGEPTVAAMIADSARNAKLTVTDCDSNFVRVDAETFVFTVRIEPLENFLFGVRFAGDGLAVRVTDGRPVTLPEYMTLPPVVEIRKIDDHGPQKNKEWLTKQLDVLGKFQEELYKAVNASIEAETPKQEAPVNVEPVQST